MRPAGRDDLSFGRVGQLLDAFCRPIMDYIEKRRDQMDPDTLRKSRARASHFVTHDGVLKLVDGLLSNEVGKLSASPNCAPWGSQTRGLLDVQERRDLEKETLEFLAGCCILQHLRGLSYLIENSAFSDIFTKSPL